MRIAAIIPPAIVAHVKRIPHPHTLHEALIHMAVVVFALDALASVWPAFNVWWSTRFHFVVAAAVLVEALANHGDVFNRHVELATLAAMREMEEKHDAQLAALKASKARLAKAQARKSSTT